GIRDFHVTGVQTCALPILIQDDASLSIAQVSERVGLSTTPCWRRLQKLEREGYIDGRVTLLNQSRIGLDLTVFVMIRTSQHNTRSEERRVGKECRHQG